MDSLVLAEQSSPDSSGSMANALKGVLAGKSQVVLDPPSESSNLEAAQKSKWTLCPLNSNGAALAWVLFSTNEPSPADLGAGAEKQENKRPWSPYQFGETICR